jgi:hypothetical protein
MTCARDLTDDEVRDCFFDKLTKDGLDLKVKRFRGHEDHVIFRGGPPAMQTKTA